MVSLVVLVCMISALSLYLCMWGRVKLYRGIDRLLYRHTTGGVRRATHDDLDPYIDDRDDTYIAGKSFVDSVVLC